MPRRTDEPSDEQLVTNLDGAEVAAAVALAGELSITGALAAGHFVEAHRQLARGPQAPAPDKPTA